MLLGGEHGVDLRMARVLPHHLGGAGADHLGVASLAEQCVVAVELVEQGVGQWLAHQRPEGAQRRLGATPGCPQVMDRLWFALVHRGGQLLQQVKLLGPVLLDAGGGAVRHGPMLASGKQKGPCAEQLLATRAFTWLPGLDSNQEPSD